jgi:putative acetyltransferase
MRIVTEQPEHRNAVLELNRQAFGGTFESDLIERLDRDGLLLASLVALDGEGVVGHIAFSRLEIEAGGRAVMAAALAPMCVAHSRQRQSIGSALVFAGIEIVRRMEVEAVIVLGHEYFYPRFGFRHDLVARLSCAYNARDAFMGLELVPGALAGRQGKCSYPSAFDG